MRRLIAFLLVLGMVIGFAAWGERLTVVRAESKVKTGDGTLKLMWHQAMGIDTMFECPWWDIQHLGPWMVYESLVAQEADGSTITGQLASDWTISEDGLTYTFTIRDGVTWHDGKPLTTYDVAWSLSSGAQSPTSQMAKTTLGTIEGAAEAAEKAASDPAATTTILSGITYDDTTVSVKIAAPNKMFLVMLAMQKILPAHVYESIPLTNMKGLETYVGTGPYKLGEVKFPDYYTLVPNNDYWGKQPGISKVLLTSYAAGGNDAAINAMITGELDYVYGNAMSDITVAENIVAQNPATTYDIQSSTYNRKLNFNLKGRGDGKDNADLQKTEVRQAFSLLLDKGSMASVYAGQAEPLTTFVPNGNPLYNSDIPVFKRDLVAAKAMLDAAGFDYSRTIKIVTYYTDQATTDLMAFMKQNFAEAGVSVETAQLDSGAYAVVAETLDYDIIYASNGSRANAIQQYETVCSFFAQDYGIKEEREKLFDADYKGWLAAQDDVEARKHSDALQVALVENCYQIPIYAMNTIVTYNQRVTLPTDLTVYDNLAIRNWHWEDWSIKQ